MNHYTQPQREGKDSDGLGDLGKQFWQWLQDGLADHSLIINDSKAQVHIVNEHVFLVSPGIFKRFSAKVLGDEGRWKSVQTRFQKLGHHLRDGDKNIHQVLVDGPNKKSHLKGYLIKDPSLVMRKKVPDNRLLTLEKNQKTGEKKDE